MSFKPAKAPSKSNLAKQWLDQYESAELKLQELRRLEPRVFDAIDKLNAEKEEAQEAVKRIFHTTYNKPAETEMKGSSYDWAETDYFKVEVQYKRRSDYYNPELLPAYVVSLPGVVRSVDKERLDRLVADSSIPEHLRRATIAALVQGEAMTPSVLIKRK